MFDFYSFRKILIIFLAFDNILAKTIGNNLLVIKQIFPLNFIFNFGLKMKHSTLLTMMEIYLKNIFSLVKFKSIF